VIKQPAQMAKGRPVERKVDMVGNAEPECILFCRKVAPNRFDIKDGFAVVPDTAGCFNDGVCMISNFTKVVFVFEP
jgi:hypothetical protein